MATFSGAVKLTNLDDYIAPSQECIKPIKFDKTADKFSPTSLSIQEDGSYVEIDQGKATKLEKAKITLNDCLACSGCVTSAETVLIAEQTYKELLKTLSSTDDHHKMVVVSVSPQSCASLSVKYGLPFDQMSSKLVSFFKSLGVHYVFDITFSRDISLMESACEFVERFNNTTKPGSLPMLASACPGWICYAEKTHGDHILPHISTTKSPQQIMGSLVKDYLANMEGKTPDQIYHVTIMPCYDKKLEASREDFYQDMYRTRDVDCVITSGEVETMLTERGVDISSLPLTPMDHPFCSYEGNELVGHNGGGSGGYMEYIFKYASQKLFHQKIDRVNYTILRNKDFQECSLEIDGQVVLRFASAYGFRNIQNIVQKLKRKKCTYHYIEVMACPSGCLNGGGQIKDSDGNAQSISKATLESVEASYNSSKHRSPDDNPYMASLYQDWLDKGTEPDKVKLLLHTQYHAVPKMSHSLNIKW